MNEENERSLATSETAESTQGSLSVKRANIFYLIYVVLSLVLSFIKIPGVPTTWMAMIYYIPVVIVAFLLCRKEGTNIKSAFGFRGVKPLSVLLTIVICIAMHSVAHLVSSLTNLAFPSFFEASGGAFLGDSFFVNFVGVALIAPFFEEFVVRGGMLNSYSRTGRLRAAVLLTALLFGLQHMNPTQFFYSFIMGIVLAILFVLTDSIWPGILFHFLNNGMAPISEVLVARFGEDFVQNYIFPFSRGLSDMKSALITITAAVVGLVITILCMRGIARHQGSEEKLRLCVRGGGGSQKLITWPMIVVLVILVLMTAATTYGLIMQSGALQ